MSLVSFVVAGFIGLLFGRVGESGGCPPAIDGDFEPADLDNATEHIKEQLESVYNNNGLQVKLTYNQNRTKVIVLVLLYFVHAVQRADADVHVVPARNERLHQRA